MSQANFMRNLRMTMPQYITNVVSFNDSIKILKNKGILTEADEKGRWTNADGKSMYAQFKEIDNLNGQEVLIGIDYEMQKNEELTKKEAAKIVLKNLKKNPIYYTSTLMSGKEGYEPEYIGGKSAQPEAHQMQYLDKNMSNIVDKKRGMQLVKNVEKVKKDADAKKETNKVESDVSLMSLVAKATRGVQKMDATGEKMKKVVVKEAKLSDLFKKPSSNPTKPTSSKSNNTDEKKPSEKSSVPHTIFSKNKNIDLMKLTKESLLQMIREELKEITGAYGGDAMSGEDGSSYMQENDSLDVQYVKKEKEKDAKEDAIFNRKTYYDYEEWKAALFAKYPKLKANADKYLTPDSKGNITVKDPDKSAYGFWHETPFNKIPSGMVFFNAESIPSDIIYPPGSRMD